MKGLRQVLYSELIGTALLVFAGLSIVIAMFGTGSPVTELIPDPGTRRLITGFLFGTTGALIAVSRVGKVSGAHINPAVTLSFWWLGKLKTNYAAVYIVAQCAGAILGAVPLLMWGRIGESIAYGATLPGVGLGPWLPLAGEVATTFALIFLLFLFIGTRRLAPWTPLLFPLLYALMVYLEAPLSGTSTNPARSLGPAVVSGHWHDAWIYLLGPVAGAGLATVMQRYGIVRRLEIRVAKIYHFGHDPHGIFHPAGE